MMKSTRNARDTGVYGANNTTYPIQALLHSRTVVEKDGYVATGMLTHIEGEIIEVEMSEFKTFELGDPVHLTVYAPVGIQRLHSTVIGKADGALAVLLPPRAFGGLEEKREAGRVDVHHKGTLLQVLARDVVLKSGETERVELEEWVPIVIRNISVTGVGMEVSEHSELAPADLYTVKLDLGFELVCELEIVRRDSSSGQTFYGARFNGLDDLQTRKLRAFFIREQIGA